MQTTRRLCAQLGLLSGIGAAICLGFGLGYTPPRAHADGGDPFCPQDDAECSFKKPNIVFVVDYSTAMNQIWDAEQQLSRWDAVGAAITQVVQPGSFLNHNAHFALIRYGHDPDPDLPGTTIPGDESGLVDGVALDLALDTNEHIYPGCNGQVLIDTFAATPAPLDGPNMPDMGIGSWTKGGLDRAALELTQTAADHPQDNGERQSMIVVLGSGVWTSADGQTSFGPPSDDPVPVAAALFELEPSVETHVVVVNTDPVAQTAAGALAAAGGTGEAIAESAALMLESELASAVVEIIDAVEPSGCEDLAPRVMFLLDASSSMLNVDDAMGAMGETPWDQVRSALAWPEFNFFELEMAGGGAVGELALVGFAVFGDQLPAPGESKLITSYGPCRDEAIAWALDPLTACVAPGCTDPWGGPPITWTFKDGSLEPPMFPESIFNHMPACEGTDFCAGSDSYVHLGLELIAENQAAHQLAGFGLDAEYPTTPDTQYINILITDGTYNGYSTDAQVQAALEAMVAVGVTTHVIGFGAPAQTPSALAELEAMAAWGSGGALQHHAAPTLTELEQALQTIAATLEHGPCCPGFGCNDNCNPWSDCSPLDEEGSLDDAGDTEESGDGDGDSNDTSTTGDADSGDPSETGDGSSEETGAPEPGDEIGETGETGDADAEAGSTPADDGCNCSSTPAQQPWPALLLLVGLGLRRRSRE